MKQTIFLTSLTVAMLAFTSCSSDSGSKPTGRTSSAVYQEGVPGGIAVDTQKITATVTAIDPEKREVTLVDRNGKKLNVKCGPEVRNFDQIRVGDQLKATVTEQVAVAMANSSNALPQDGQAGVVALAPKGAKPGAVMANTTQVTATVKDINLKRHEVTLSFPDGTSHKFPVRPDVDLGLRRVGEQVVIRTTEAVAVSVEQP